MRFVDLARLILIVNGEFYVEGREALLNTVTSILEEADSV